MEQPQFWFNTGARGVCTAQELGEAFQGTSGAQRPLLGRVLPWARRMRRTGGPDGTAGTCRIGLRLVAHVADFPWRGPS
jgi:hypothetical protein